MEITLETGKQMQQKKKEDRQAMKYNYSKSLGLIVWPSNGDKLAS